MLSSKCVQLTRLYPRAILSLSLQQRAGYATSPSKGSSSKGFKSTAAKDTKSTAPSSKSTSTPSIAKDTKSAKGQIGLEISNKKENALWTVEELVELEKHMPRLTDSIQRGWLHTLPIGMTAKKLENIEYDYNNVEDPTAKGIKHSALLVCSINYVRSPMVHGVLSKMLADIGKRKEWALAGAGVESGPSCIPIAETRFILNREGCPVYAHRKGNRLNRQLFQLYEYVIDVQKRDAYELQETDVTKAEWERKRKFLASFIPHEKRKAEDLKKEHIIDYSRVSFEVLYDKIYEGCRNFLLTIYPKEAKKIPEREIKDDKFKPDGYEKKIQNNKEYKTKLFAAMKMQ